MADVDVKQLLLQVDASVELLRTNLMRGDSAVARFAADTQRRLDATDRRFGALGRPLGNIAGTVARTNAQIATIGATAQRVERQLVSSSAGMKTALLASTSGIAAAFSAEKVANYADTYTRFTNSLKVAGLEGGKLNQTQNDLYAIAQKYGVALEGLGQLYGGISSLQKDLNISSADTLGLTQAVGAAIKVSGASSEKAAGAVLGLNQALAQTRVQSDEYNQILDGARPLLQAAVDGTKKYGGSLAKLKQDIEAGNVSGSDLFRILANGFDGINAKAEKAELTIGNAFIVLNNALGKYIGEAGTASGATGQIAAGIEGLANNLDMIVPALTVIGVAFATKMVAPGIATASAETLLFIKALDSERLVMLGGKVAAAQKAQAVVAGTQAEIAAIESTLVARRADSAQIAANLVLIDRQRAAALQAQAAISANAAAGFGRIGLGNAGADAARANQDLKAQIVTRRALAAANAEIAASEAALAAAQARSATATVAATAATNAATLAARAGATASRLFAGGLTLIGGSVGGGAAVLAIGAVVSAIMLFSDGVAEAKQRDAEFVQSGKDLSGFLREVATLSTSAARQLADVGTTASGAVGGVNSMTGAASNLATSLRDVAEQARRAKLETAKAFEAKARADVTYYSSKYQGNQQSTSSVARFGYYDPYGSTKKSEDDAFYLRNLREAQSREAAARKAREVVEKEPWANFTPSANADRTSDLDMGDREQRVGRDLKIARAGGDKDQVRSLEAQKFAVDQYKKYRKDGLSSSEATTQAGEDAAKLRSAQQSKADNDASLKAGRGAAAEKRKEEAAMRDAAADSRAYAAASRQADNDIASAKASLSGSAAERAEIEKTRIQAERTNRDDEIASMGPNGAKRYSDDEVKILQAKNTQRADLETELVDLNERRRVAQETLDTTVAGLEVEQDMLSARSVLATATTDRRDLELRILDIQQQEEEARLRAVTVVNGATETEEKIAQARLAKLNELYGLKREQVGRDNEGPMERYRRETMDRVANYGENLETVEVAFFENLNDQLAVSATRFLKLKGAAGDFFNQLIADVIRLNIQQASGGAGGLLGGLMKLTGLGGASGSASGGIVVNQAAIGNAVSGLPGFSGGGWTGSGSRTDVSGVVHGQEFVFDAPATARIGRSNLEAMRAGSVSIPRASSATLQAASSRSGGVVRIEVGEGALFAPRVTAIAGGVTAQVVTAVAPTTIAAAEQGAVGMAARKARRTIR